MTTINVTLDKKDYLEGLLSSMQGPISEFNLFNVQNHTKMVKAEASSLTFQELKEIALENPDKFIIVEGVFGQYIETKRHLGQIVIVE